MNTNDIELDVMCQALTELDFYSRFVYVSNIQNLKLHEGETMPDLTIIQNKCNEIRPSVYSKYALKYLRQERDNKLLETDKYTSIPDWPHPSEEVKQAWITYRQALRDLPTTSTPQLDENGKLTNVTWPTPPS